MICGFGLVSPLRESKSTDAVYTSEFKKIVAGNQRIAIVDCIVEARADIRVPARHQCSQTKIGRRQRRIQNRCTHQIVIVSFVTIGFKEERGLLFDDRPAQTSAELPLLIWRALAGANREWIA